MDCDAGSHSRTSLMMFRQQSTTTRNEMTCEWCILFRTGRSNVSHNVSSSLSRVKHSTSYMLLLSSFAILGTRYTFEYSRTERARGEFRGISRKPGSFEHAIIFLNSSFHPHLCFSDAINQILKLTVYVNYEIPLKLSSNSQRGTCKRKRASVRASVRERRMSLIPPILDQKGTNFFSSR
jgi:hypothetical protein